MEKMHVILKRLRKEKGYSQQELAELLGISSAAVSKWESAVTMPDISQIVPLTNIFGVSADELFGISGYGENEEIDKILFDLYKLEDIYPPEDGIKIVEAYMSALKDHPKNITLLSATLSFSTSLIAFYDVLSREEEEKLLVNIISTLLASLHTHVTMLGNLYRVQENNYEDALCCYSFARSLLDSFYKDENYRPPFISRGVSSYGFPAECLVNLGRDSEALLLLEDFAEKYTAERKYFNVKKSFDNPMIRGAKFSYGMDGKSKFSEYYEQVVNMQCFDKLRETTSFIATVKKLESDK